jgi:hypothetical protein
MEKKICSKCKEEKDVCEFGVHNSTKDRLRTSCKECRKIDGKIYRENNVNKRKETLQNWYNKNPEYNKNYYINNTDKVKKINKNWYNLNKEKHRESNKIWEEKNKEKVKQYNRNYMKITRETNPLKKIQFNIRSRFYNILKTNKIPKNNRTLDIVGCSLEFLKEHLEKQFTNGMSWENYSRYGWHIDHIIPLSSATTEEEIYKLCHYTNLQPLWAEDNLKKSDKILN